MSLSERERKIIAFVEHNALATVETIGKSLKLRPHVVRFCLRRLQQNGFLRQQYLFNSFRLGYTEYGVLCTLNYKRPTEVRRFLEYLVDSSRITYVLELAGEFQFQFSVLATEPDEFSSFMSLLGVKFPAVFKRRTTIQTLYLYELGSKRLHPHASAPHTLVHLGGPRRSYVLDELDHNILKFLATTPEKSVHSQAIKLGVSASTVTYRLKRLEKEGIISGCRYIVDLDNRILLSYRFLIKVACVTQTLRDSLFRFCQAHSSVTFLVGTIGSWDFVLGVRGLNPDTAFELVRELEFTFQDDHLEVTVLSAHTIHKLTNYPFRSLGTQK